MARIVWAGTPPSQKRHGGAVLYTSPYTPLQRQAPTPARSGLFQNVQAGSALGLLAFFWSSVLSSSDRAGWSAAAVAPLNGYTLFLQVNLPAANFLGTYVAAPYLPNDVNGLTLIWGWTDTILHRAYIAYYFDCPVPQPLPLYLAMYWQLSDLWTSYVSGHSATPGRYVRAASGFVAFGTLGPLVPNGYTYADVTDAVLATFGQLPENFSGPNALGYQQGGQLNAQGIYMDATGAITTLATKIKFPVARGWDPIAGYVMGIPPAVSVPLVPSARTAGMMR